MMIAIISMAAARMVQRFVLQEGLSPPNRRFGKYVKKDKGNKMPNIEMSKSKANFTFSINSIILAQKFFQKRSLEVQAVLGLVENNRIR